MADHPVPEIRDETGRFRKGQSGNRAGKPRGARNKATILAQNLLAGEAEGITRALIREAIAGQPMALKLAMERLWPVRRGSPIAINLPPIATASDALAAMRVVVESLASGHLSPEEASELASLVDAGRRVVETSDHELRLIELEATRER